MGKKIETQKKNGGESIEERFSRTLLLRKWLLIGGKLAPSFPT